MRKNIANTVELKTQIANHYSVCYSYSSHHIMTTNGKEIKLITVTDADRTRHTYTSQIEQNNGSRGKKWS